MKYKTIIIIWLFYFSSAFSECEKNSQRIYNYSFNDSIVTYILLNHNSIIFDIRTRKGDYLDSLLTQLNFKNDDTTLNNLIDLVNKYLNAYDFAVAITKDKI